METPESRRQAGALVHAARKTTGLSQRALAKEVEISETWLRALTVGLRGEEPQRASDSTWIALAEKVGLDPKEVFEALGRDLPDLPEPPERFAVERTTHEGRALEIVHDLEVDTDDLPDDVADEIIRKSVEHMAAQARIMVEAERRRWERQRDE